MTVRDEDGTALGGSGVERLHDDVGIAAGVYDDGIAGFGVTYDVAVSLQRADSFGDDLDAYYGLLRNK
jgi:hypothetical protein